MKKWHGGIALLMTAILFLSSCGELPRETREGSREASRSAETTPVVTTAEEPILVDLYENLSSLKDRTTRPTEFDVGSGFDDLIYYDTEEQAAEKKFAALPAGKEVADPSFFLQNYHVSNSYGSVTKKSVNDGVGFSEVIYANIDKTPEKVSNVQCSVDVSGIIGNGQYALICFWIRNVGETDMAELRIGIEQTVTYNKLLNVTIRADSRWHKFYVPVIYDASYQKLIFRFGAQKQKLEIGDIRVWEYDPDKVAFEDLPDNRLADYLNEGASWRQEAWERIGQYRKGDFEVIVQDRNGNPIPDAKVEAEMFEHEFLWTGCCNSFFTKTPEYRENLVKYFNSAVVGTFTKWGVYEKYPGSAMKIVQKLNELGIDRVRGHCLFWDRPDRDTLIPADVLTLVGQPDALKQRILSHVKQEASEFESVISEWDVVNEAFGWHGLQDALGDKSILKDCFAAARSVLGEDGILYFNDNIMDDRFVTFMNEVFVAQDIDYDGIGMQSHYSDVRDPEEIYDFYCKMEAFGKRLKVTEYDFNCTNEERVAAFTRDVMILSFSMEKMEGFAFWSMNDGNAVSFHEDWTPRLALEQIADLIYNKWWTRDVSLRTDEKGSTGFNGFFGGYYITVTHNGVRKKVAVDLFQGGDHTVVVTLP